jgi:RES domain-containing protein
LIVLWKIVKERRRADAFTGEGARLAGGRWNERGTPVVYASESLSLSALETLVHVQKAHMHIAYISFRIEVPDGVRVEEFPRTRLPANWRKEPPPKETMGIGTRWAKDRSTVVLKVPSVIIPQEHNYVLNPLHPDFRKIVKSETGPFGFDPRMWK